MWYAYINIYVYIIDNWYIVNLHLLENLKGFFGSRVTFSKSTPLDSAVLPKGIPGTLGTRRKEAFRTLTELKAAPTAFLTQLVTKIRVIDPNIGALLMRGFFWKPSCKACFPRISKRNIRWSWSLSSSGTRKIHHVEGRCISQNQQTKRSRSKNKQNKVFVIDESGFILLWPPWTPKDSITKLGRWVKLEFTKQQKLGMEKWIYSKKRWEQGNSFSSKKTSTQQHTEHERAVNKHPHVERTNWKKKLLIKFVKQNNPRKKMMQGNNWAYLVSVARFWPQKAAIRKGWTK